MSDLQNETLVGLLAAVDAVFIPLRNPHGADNGVRTQARMDYAKTGVSFTSSRMGTLRASRMAFSRTIDVLIAGGLVQRHSAEFLSLTARGDLEARAMAGLPALRDARGLLKQLIDHQTDARGFDYIGHAWMPETVYAGVEWGDNARRGKFVQLEERMLPLLVRGFAESNCDPVGHCYYAPTPLGISWSSAAHKTVPPEAGRVEDLRTLYYAEVKRGVPSLPKQAERLREIGQIPMPMSISPRGLTASSTSGATCSDRGRR